MKCTIVVPLYNKAATVTRALESIRTQTLADFEVVIVDDGSRDASAARVQEFLQRTGDARFRYIHQGNAGPGAARNRGVGEGRAALVAFLDADDEWLPQHLETCCQFLDEHPEAAAATSTWLDKPGDTSSRLILAQHGVPSGSHQLSPESPVSILLGLMVVMWPCTTVIRREAFERFGGFREHRCLYGEDAFLFLQVALNCPVGIIPTETALFYRDASELSGNYRGMRPIEPFLEEPDLVRRTCPEPMRPLLEQFLAARAMKTAAVLSYWGQWRQARELLRQFQVPGQWRLPWYLPSRLACTPLGALIGRVDRLRKAS